MKLSQIARPVEAPVLVEGVNMSPSHLASEVLDDEHIRIGFEVEWFDRDLILHVPESAKQLRAHPDFNESVFAEFVEDHRASLIDELDINAELGMTDEELEESTFALFKKNILTALGLDVSTPLSISSMGRLVDDFEASTGIDIKEYCIGYRCSDNADYSGYVLETDSFGPELISPPLTMRKMIGDLEKIFQYLRDRPTAETTKEKGIHISVSIKGKTKADYDFLKMLMFIGERNELLRFGRLKNTNTLPHMPQVIKKLTQVLSKEYDEYGDIDINSWLGDDAIRTQLIGAISKVMDGEKFRSFNLLTLNKPQPYVEFRIAGNENFEERFEEIKNLAMRVAYVMKLGSDKDLERDEYMKKLYKLMSSVKGFVQLT